MRRTTTTSERLDERYAIHFQRVNGYPNNFWGWGAEDDELRLRTELEARLPILRPVLAPGVDKATLFADLEAIATLSEKKRALKVERAENAVQVRSILFVLFCLLNLFFCLLILSLLFLLLLATSLFSGSCSTPTALRGRRTG